MTMAIKHDQLKTLATNGGVKSVTLLGHANGFILTVVTLSGTKTLHTKAGDVRLFKKLETALDYLKYGMGIAKASIQFEHWNPKQATLK